MKDKLIYLLLLLVLVVLIIGFFSTDQQKRTIGNFLIPQIKKTKVIKEYECLKRIEPPEKGICKKAVGEQSNFTFLWINMPIKAVSIDSANP